MASRGSFLLAILFLPFVLFSAPICLARDSKVSLALYYETLCPFCSNFIVNYLAKIWDNGLISIVDLELIPYGNARIRSNGTITCQHGKYECLLNTVEACAIDAWPDLDVHFGFINCVETLVIEHKYLEWESCFAATGLDSKPVLECYENGYGHELDLKYAAKTNALEPPHRYVPWVVVDGEPLYEDYENFEAYICKAYKGNNRPEVCDGVVLKLSKEKKQRNSVCHKNDVGLLDTMKIEMVI
ncbi:gamma-interferon-inducible lysosomal thiol reductase isoform X1 [Carex littledalei]|uniref:Gamma-interferon-inducible lysosomal thiol reductase isoform X1 n=1 Tax=Carex littledalei TaxID=544730 RepID=A0A833VLT2_9POAL|nr:gamma-interferon-inducible lysosomal thiol reductase isoform X1 [Carex littledalei]